MDDKYSPNQFYPYKGFLLLPQASYLNTGGFWYPGLVIYDQNGLAHWQVSCDPESRCRTLGQAVKKSLDWGKKLVDGSEGQVTLREMRIRYASYVEPEKKGGAPTDSYS